LVEADIVENRYPLKGFYCYPNYGVKIVKNVISVLEKLLEKYHHEEWRFPTLIPYNLFKKEKKFLEAFKIEGYIVNSTLTQKLGEDLILRPTSESAIYSIFSLRIKSYRDLPKKIYQTVNTFRCETKMTKPLLRLREIMFFNEAHTFHSSKEEAENQIKEAINIYKKFFNKIGLPYIVVRTPKTETFGGAEYNYDFITILQDGKLCELGSVINLGQNFAKAFNIKFMDKDEKWKYVWQTCYGTSESMANVCLFHTMNLKNLEARLIL
jgi:prolyl-tRNA synthetase